MYFYGIKLGCMTTLISGGSKDGRGFLISKLSDLHVSGLMLTKEVATWCGSLIIIWIAFGSSTCQQSSASCHVFGYCKLCKLYREYCFIFKNILSEDFSFLWIFLSYILKWSPQIGIKTHYVATSNCVFLIFCPSFRNTSMHHEGFGNFYGFYLLKANIIFYDMI